MTTEPTPSAKEEYIKEEYIREIKVLKGVIVELYGKKKLTFEEKLKLALKLYEGLKVEEKKGKYQFEYSIGNGWCSPMADTLENGLDKLLSLKSDEK